MFIHKLKLSLGTTTRYQQKDLSLCHQTGDSKRLIFATCVLYLPIGTRDGNPGCDSLCVQQQLKCIEIVVKYKANAFTTADEFLGLRES